MGGLYNGRVQRNTLYLGSASLPEMTTLGTLMASLNSDNVWTFVSDIAPSGNAGKMQHTRVCVMKTLPLVLLLNRILIKCVIFHRSLTQLQLQKAGVCL